MFFLTDNAVFRFLVHFDAAGHDLQLSGRVPLHGHGKAHVFGKKGTEQERRRDELLPRRDQSGDERKDGHERICGNERDNGHERKDGNKRKNGHEMGDGKKYERQYFG